jgi:serine/threonine-protein kinase
MTTATASLKEDGGTFGGPVRPGDLIADKYRVERTLGEGGMGVVMAAHDEVLERRVAIKFLQPRLVGTEVAVQRFLREARAATRITSEHVARLLEIGKLPNGIPYFVMEHLQGRDLRALLREDGPLEPSVAVDYVLQALEAVAEGHLKGIVHRDLKPGNLFLSARADGSPLIKVLDFGIAKRLESYADGAESLTSTEDVRLGSPAYMPPEQLQDAREVDTRSDLWSLGATLYELICGKPPFVASDYLELVSRILSAPPTPITQELPSALRDAIMRCLEKDRQLRFANAAELAEALAPWGGHDARTSASRVTGLHASSSTMAVTRNILEPMGSASTTLPVSRESSRPPAMASSSGESVVRTKPLVVGLAMLASLLVALRALGMLGGASSSPAPVVATHRAKPEPRSASPAIVADPPVTQAELFQKAAAEPSALEHAQSAAPHSSGLSSAAHPGSPRTTAQVVPKLEASATAPSSSAASQSAASDENIQRLIQTRR